MRTAVSRSPSVSAGASVFPADGGSYETLLADADQRMYRDKAARRGHATMSHATGQAEFIATDLFDADAPLGTTLPLPQTLA